MRKWLALAAKCLVLSAPITVAADDYYVASTGDDQGQGTQDAPFASVERAQTAAAPGDTVWIRGGTYAFSGTTRSVGVSFTKSGQADRPIRYFAYAGETPVFDLFERKPQARVTGLDVQADYIHLRGLEVRGVRQIVVGDSWGVRVRGDHNVLEHLHVHDNEAPGVFITSGANNLVLNCDSHHNYDPLEAGGNADGFGCHAAGEGNVLRGCRAWENSDDGFDLINAAGACVVEHSWAFRNGFVPDTDMPAANGAGFKSGGYGYPPNTPATGAAKHVIRFSVAFANRVIGFYANFHPGAIDFIHNTAFDNPANFDMRTPGTPSSHTLRNNIAAGSGHDIINFNGGTADFNSWTLPVSVDAADFESLDHALAYAPRQPDGALTNTKLARLRADSDLIDRGEDRGFAFVGAAADLGAFEHGVVTPNEPTSPDDTDAGAPNAPDGAVPSAGSSGGAAPSGGTGGHAGAAGSTPPSAAMTAATTSAMTAATGAPGSSPNSAGGLAPAPTPTTSATGCGCQLTDARSGYAAMSTCLALLGALRLRMGRRRRRRGR